MPNYYFLILKHYEKQKMDSSAIFCAKKSLSFTISALPVKLYSIFHKLHILQECLHIFLFCRPGSA